MDQDSIYGFLSKRENFAVYFNSFHGTPASQGTQFGKPCCRRQDYILKNLCFDLLLGSDFQSQHQQVIFKYRGSKPDFTVNNDLETVQLQWCYWLHCSTVKLFINLLPNCQPVVVKSHHFSISDKCSNEKIKRLYTERIIHPCHFLWHAQVLVIHNKELGKNYFCIDYLQTKSICLHD